MDNDEQINGTIQTGHKRQKRISEPDEIVNGQKKQVEKPETVGNQQVKKGKTPVKGSEKPPRKDKSGHLLKEAMLQALAKTLGVVTPAAKQVGLRRQTHYEWMNNDPEYKSAVEDLENVALDFAESKLHALINEGNFTATIFYLKTKGKNRGYIERQEIAATNTNYNHDGDMTPEKIKQMTDELNQNI